MKVYKKLTTDFTVASNEIHRHGLSLRAIGLYLYILSKPDGWNFSIAGVESQVKDGRDSVRAAIAELEEVGFLQRARFRLKKGILGHGIWLISDKIMIKDEDFQPMTGLPTLAEPTLAEPTVDFPHKVNNKKVKNNIEKKKYPIIIREATASPNPTEEDNQSQTTNDSLTEYLEKKRERKAKKSGFQRAKPTKVFPLSRGEGLEISLRDNVPESVMIKLAEKHGIKLSDVEECKQNYINWVNGSSYDPKVWGKDMLIYVEKFVAQKASKIKEKEPDSIFDELDRIYKSQKKAQNEN